MKKSSARKRRRGQTIPAEVGKSVIANASARGVSAMIPDWVLQVIMLLVSLVFGSVIFYYYQNKQFHHALWWGYAGVVLLALGIAFYLRNDLIRAEIESKKPVYFGEILPGDEPAEPLPPNVPPNTVQLLLGDDLRVLAAHSENFMFSKGGQRFLTIGVSNGLMRLNATVVDSKNQNVLRIVNNEFKASPEHAFNPRQPDKHSLIVRDSDGQEVLNLRFLNPRAMRIVGRFHLPGYSDPVLILPDRGLVWPGGGGASHLTFDLTAGPAGLIAFE